MEQGQIAFTAVYLKANNGYVGFIEELPGVNSHGRTLDEARDTLRKLVDEQQQRLADAGLARGGTVALRLPPSLTYVAMLLAAWRIGAQVSLVDHRLTQHEVERIRV